MYMVNRNPISGDVTYSQYHKGKYLVAWHPKSSTENERHSVVYKKNGKEILVKQIAGALAKRIVNYLQAGQKVEQANEMGFIKFGSRVDLLLPLDAKIPREDWRYAARWGDRGCYLVKAPANLPEGSLLRF